MSRILHFISHLFLLILPKSVLEREVFGILIYQIVIKSGKDELQIGYQ